MVTTSSVTKTVPSSTMRQEPILPPLPTLLDISSPVARHPNMQQGTSAVDNEAASDWLLPSPSQVGILINPRFCFFFFSTIVYRAMSVIFLLH